MTDHRDEPLSLLQFRDRAGRRRTGIVTGPERIRALAGETTVRELALEALRSGRSLATVARERTGEEEVDYGEIAAEGRVLPPIDHPDAAHLIITGTGLTHLGSADARDRMHAIGPEKLTDSMKMFRAGLEGGRPAPGQPGVAPEWFYKGTGTSLVASERTLEMPAFALDGGDEPEVAGVYVIDDEGAPVRLGYALANEFSDHVLERKNYLLLAHSKLRRFPLGPELRVGALPADVRGSCRIRRDDAILWEREFVTGEANMSHTLANLEYHHFKYDIFRVPGDIHVHSFGTGTLSFADGVRCEPGDRFEIEADAFHLPLRNTLARMDDDGWIEVRAL